MPCFLIEILRVTAHVSVQHLIRVGKFGHVGRFRSVDATLYPRGSRVVCRTRRGLEVGVVLAAAEDAGAAVDDGVLARGVTPQDDLLIARQDKNRQEAFEACSQLLAQRGLPVVLIDVEHLFDGKSLYFYFLGEVNGELEELTDELAETYEAKVQFRRFTETVNAGCGPDCGTEAAGGCGESGCSTCAVSGACGSKSDS